MIFHTSKVIGFLLLLLSNLFLLFNPAIVRAAGSCTATVSPSSIQANTAESPFVFSITNTGASAVEIVNITRPSAEFTLINFGVPGWTVESSPVSALLYGGSIAPSGSTDITFWATVGPNESASANWQITVDDGTGEGSCTGSLGTAIVGAADVSPPVISSVGASGVTSVEATITWTTNESATSKVDYGTTNSYGTVVEDSNLKTSHSIKLTGLSANTKYFYKVSSTDSSGNTAVGGVNDDFTTAAAGLVTATATPTPTATAAPTPTPTPTPVPVDRAPPRVSIATELEEPFETPPLITGRATDNEEVVVIDYSTDGGVNWLPVDLIEDAGSRSTSYEFTPFLNEDGNYPIQVRARDKRGNTGTSSESILVIDRLPPLVGGNLISLGPQPLMPNDDGTLVALAGLEQKITLSAVGGPTAIDLFVGEQKIPLEYSAETGLWSGFLDLNEVGTYTLSTKAVDGADNKTSRELNSIQVISAGKIIDGDINKVVKSGKIKVSTQDPHSGQWNLWDAAAFSQSNPQSLNNGSYQFFLPPGTYYLQIESNGFSNIKTQIFTLHESRPINANFTLTDGRAIQLGPFRLGLPSFMQKTLAINFALPKIVSPSSSNASLLGSIAPSFSLSTEGNSFELSSLFGETKVVSFINTWSPPAVEQISIIDKLLQDQDLPIVMVAPQETGSKIAIFRQRGNYQTPIWADPDGELVKEYQLSTLPTHFVLDSRGRIKQIITQVLNQEQFLALLLIGQ